MLVVDQKVGGGDKLKEGENSDSDQTASDSDESSASTTSRNTSKQTAAELKTLLENIKSNKTQKLENIEKGDADANQDLSRFLFDKPSPQTLAFIPHWHEIEQAGGMRKSMIAMRLEPVSLTDYIYDKCDPTAVCYPPKEKHNLNKAADSLRIQWEKYVTIFNS
jgi:hypothetical protein